MLLACPKCEATYRIEVSALGDQGRTVRCVRCSNAWFAAASDLIGKKEAVGALFAVPDEADDVAWSVPPTEVPSEKAPPNVLRSRDGAPPDHIDEGEPLPDFDAPPLVPEIVAARVNASWNKRTEPTSSRSVRAGSASKRSWLKWPPSAHAVSASLAAILVLLAFFRAEIVRYAPQTASLFAAIGLGVNLRGLAFENVKVVGSVQEGLPVIVVDGTIHNVAARNVDLPRLRFAIRNAFGQEIYVWTALQSRPNLDKGQSIVFSSRLAAPPNDGREVAVRFFSKRDVASGLK